MEVDVKDEKNTDVKKKVNTQFDYLVRGSPASTSNPLQAKSDQHDSRAMEESDIYNEESNASGSEVGKRTWDPWFSWFCSLRGNEFFCKVDQDYIADGFNHRRLGHEIPYYNFAVELMMGATGLDELATDLATKLGIEQAQKVIENATQMLYGMIFARFIWSDKGLSAMALKYKDCNFGRCPRVHCAGRPCLPVVQIDIPRSSTVDIDGVYFDTIFPHHFFMTFPHLKPQNHHRATSQEFSNSRFTKHDTKSVETEKFWPPICRASSASDLAFI